MSGSERIGSRSARMTTEEIVQRAFSSKGRGISESDVRSFLKRVAQEVERLGKREDELLGRISSLESDLESKPKVTKHDLLEGLGEQTARVLSSAEEAAEQMVTDAREESEAILTNAKTESEKMISASRAQADETVSEAQSRVRALRESADRDSETIVSQARTEGRELFQESVVVREQILKDLLRRRDLLLEQIDELRKGREELLDSYKVVKGSFQKATDALHSVEEKASSELLTAPIDVDELLKTPIELPSVLDANQPITKHAYDQETAENSAPVTSEKEVDLVHEQAVEDQDIPSITGKRKGIKGYMKDALGVGEDGENVSGDAASHSEPTAGSPERREGAREESLVASVPSVSATTEKQSESGSVKTVTKKKDVGALFESLKQKNDVVRTSTPAIPAQPTAGDVNESVVVQEKESKPSAKKSSKKKKGEPLTPIQARDDVISQMSTSLVRKAKRQLQDEQNELLESLRTLKSKKHVAAVNILPDEQTHLKVWEETLRSDLESVFAAGSMTVSKEAHTYDQDALAVAVNWVVTPLRETLTQAIDEGDQADAGSRVGARYREWRNTELNSALNDAMCSAYNTGVISAAKAGATIKWHVEQAGRCPDCDDNALENTTVGEAFPTGQVAPPAHAGCHCVITVA